MRTKNSVLAEELKQRKVDVEKLVVVFLGGSEMIIGEDDSNSPSHIVALKNPKRIVRVTQSTPNGLIINVFLSDLEGLSGDAEMFVSPVGHYFVRKQSEESKQGLYSMLKAYFAQKDAERIAKSGLITPQSPFPSVRK